MGDPLSTWQIVQIVLTVAATVYQQKQQKKLKDAQKRQAELAKDNAATRNVRPSGSSRAIDFIYGYSAADGITVNVNTSATLNTNNITQPNFGTMASQSGKANEFLVMQKVIGFGPLDDIVDVTIDGQSVTDETYNSYSRIETKLTGGEQSFFGADSSSSIDYTNLFNDIAYSTEAYKINRDEPQFGGPPDTFFYIRGRKIRYLVEFGGNAIFGVSKNFSNNAVRVLLDYLLDSDVGLGLSEDDLDLNSFYRAQEVANTIVVPNASVNGKVFGSATSRNILKYEFNGIISSSNDHMDNIATILDVMPGAIFLRDATGKIKLNLPDVENDSDNEQLAVGTIDDDVLVGYVDISYPDSSEKLNAVTIKFPNASKDFAQDTYTYNNDTFKQQDSQVKLETSVSLSGISNLYHARYFAENTVSVSRRATFTFKMTSEGFLYEPGDIVTLVSPSQNINTQIRIGDITVKQDMTVDIVGTEFEKADYTWTNTDNEFVTPALNFNFVIGIPSITDAFFDNDIYAATVSWQPAANESNLVNQYTIYRKNVFTNEEYKAIATVSATTYQFIDDSIVNAGQYRYHVEAVTSNGRRSGFEGQNYGQIDAGGIVANQIVTITIYAASRTTAVIPAGTYNYNFETLELSPVPSGWSTIPPVVGEGYSLWQSTATISGQANSIYENVEFSTPAIISVPGSDGEDGEPGEPGEDGISGGMTLYYRIGPPLDPGAADNWTQAQVAQWWENAILQNGYPTERAAPIKGDILWLFTSEETSQGLPTAQWVYRWSHLAVWESQTQVIDGNLLVTNTITADKLNVNSIDSISADIGTITAGLLEGPNQRFVLDLSNNVLKIFDENGTLRVKLGDLSQ